MKVYLVRIETNKYDMKVVVVQSNVNEAFESAINYLSILKNIRFTIDDITDMSVNEWDVSYSQIIESQVKFLEAKEDD